MTRHLQSLLIPTCLCLLVTAVLSVEKWSRQLEPSGPSDASSFDWVPLAQPVDGSSKDRSANARVLTYSQSFPPNGRFGDFPKPHNPPPQQQQAFDFPYQFQGFGNAPQAPLRQRQQISPFTAPQKNGPLQSQEPTSQSFFKFEMPLHGDHGGNRQIPGGPPSVQTGYQIQHTFGGGAQATLFSSPLFNQQPVFPPEFHPIPQKPHSQQLQQKPLPQQNYIDDSYPVKNAYRESKPLPTQQSLQTVSPQVFPQGEDGYELNKPASFQAQSPYQQTAQAPTGPASASGLNTGGQQDVQLLYVPYDTLYNQQKQNSAFEVNKFNANPGLPAVNPYQINQFYTQDPLAPLEPNNYYSTSTTNRPTTTTTKQENIFQNFVTQQLTTPKPKPKAHQPPLAMFILRSSSRPTQSDVVSALRNSNTIAVVDAPTKQIPDIFVGPAGMPIPEGYVKFDLPYLSQLAQTHDLRDVPFFVAPLSYRTPNGFNKILLPEPHVGSIVVNRAKDINTIQLATPAPPKNQIYNTPAQNDVTQYQTSTPRPRPTHRVKQPGTTKDYYADLQKNQNQFDITTQRATLQPSRGNKFSYFYDQDAIHEVTSPKISHKDRPKKKRPQNVQVEQPTYQQTINNPYAQFQPAPNQILNDDYYKLQPNKPSTSSTSTSTTTTTTTSTTTTPAPPNFFTYSTSPQVEFQSTNGQLYHNFDSAPKAPVEEHVPRFTTRPPPTTNADEEYRMKQYFRQQDAFRNRPQVANPTNPPFEQVHYSPVNLDYDREVTIPATTLKTTTPKQRITYYTPTEAPATTAEENFNTVPPNEHFEFNRDKVTAEKSAPVNHRPSYIKNEIPDSTVEYEPNPYQLPSELPPLTPNLPGLVNNLQDKQQQNAVEQSSPVTPALEQEQPTRPTRRPINRVRKPVVSKVTSSVTFSESETTSRRPSQRVRRPYGSRGSASSTTEADEESTPSPTRRPSSAARNPLIRNPNRIRYQPTPEERTSLRIKPRKQYNGSKKASETEDLDYQRDVLKQNYPVFKGAGSRTPTSPTAIPSSYAAAVTTEGPTSETQQVYTVTPSNTIETEQTFPAGILEPMQIAQQYNQYSKDNYGPGYFPNQEELNPTEPIAKNEIQPVYATATSVSTSTTTTTEEPQVTTRRSPFLRRNYPRLRTTTTETPTTTTPSADERPSRPRVPPRKVIKVRARTRRPAHPASSTTAPAEEEQPEQPKSNYRKLNRFNQDLYENDTPKRRYKQQFHLDGQESQWSPPQRVNSFRPINPKDKRIEEEHKFENEPEILTISPEQTVEDEKKPDTFDIKVSANFGSSGAVEKTTLKEPNLKPEKSFAELLEEVMGKAPEEKPLETETESTKTTDGTYFESQKTTVGDRLNRRGKWKKTKIPTSQNNESFETAESQNLAPQLYNSLYNVGQRKTTEEILKATTPMTPAATTEAMTTAMHITTTAQATMDEYDMTTPKQQEITTMPTTPAMDDLMKMDAKTTTMNADVMEESATRRHDEEDLMNAEDLDTQPSLFSEVKKQLHELFAIEESEDQAVTAALAAVGKRRQEYTSIKRTKSPDTTLTPETDGAAPVTEPTVFEGKKKAAPSNLMDNVVYATSTSTKVSSETEICYRGRCIRSEDLPANHKLN